MIYICLTTKCLQHMCTATLKIQIKDNTYVCIKIKVGRISLPNSSLVPSYNFLLLDLQCISGPRYAMTLLVVTTTTTLSCEQVGLCVNKVNVKSFFFIIIVGGVIFDLLHTFLESEVFDDNYNLKYMSRD